MKLIPTPQPLSQALLRAMERGLLPSWLGSWAQRQALTLAVRAVSVFSARTTNALYLEIIKQAAERALKAGYNNDRGQLRLELKEMLRRLGYTPERGFPGDEKLDIPPAEPGSLQDLSSDRRIDLILDTQERLMHGAGQKARGLTRTDTFPAWELVRIYPRKVPRGTEASGTKGWPARWLEAGGKFLLDDKGQTLMANGEARLIALKDDPIWNALGDSARFEDALDVDHPPWAFNSGKGWQEKDERELNELIALHPQNRDALRRVQETSGPTTTKPGEASTDTAQRDPAKIVPEPKFNTGGMDPDFKAKLIEKLKGVQGGTLTEKQLGAMGREVKLSLGNALLAALKGGA